MPDKIEMGAKAVCKACGKELEYVGPYWRHSGLPEGMQPRHIAVPSEIVEQSQEESEPDGMLANAIAVAKGEWPHTMDAKVWARKWMEHIKENPDMATDEGAMLGWFANAIMAGYDTAMHRVAFPES